MNRLVQSTPVAHLMARPARAGDVTQFDTNRRSSVAKKILRHLAQGLHMYSVISWELWRKSNITHCNMQLAYNENMLYVPFSFKYFLYLSNSYIFPAVMGIVDFNKKPSTLITLSRFGNLVALSGATRLRCYAVVK